MTTILGTVEKKDIGVGTWVLAGDDGTTYELRNLPADLKRQGLRVSLMGEILEEEMSIAMIGPIFSITQATQL